MESKTPPWLIVLTIVMVILAMLAVGWLVWGRDLFVKKDDAAKEPPKQVETPTETPTEIPTETPMVTPTEELAKVPEVTMTVEPTADIPEPVEEEVLAQGEHGVEMAIMPSNGTVNHEPAEVLQIRQWFQETEQDNNLNIEKFGNVTIYRKGATIVKVRLTAGQVSAISDERLIEYTREYFYRDEQLYFVHIHNGKPTGERFYYVDGQVIRYSPKEGTDYYNADIAPYLELAYTCRSESEIMFWDNSSY